MKYLKLIILAIFLINTSCQQSDDLLESTTVDYSTTITQDNRADFTGRVKRVKIKRKRVGSGFSVTAFVGNDPTIDVASIELSIEEQDGIIASPANSVLEIQDTNIGGVKYVLEEIMFEGEIENKLIRMSLIMKNSAGEILGTPNILYTTIGDFEPAEGVDINAIKITKTPDNQHAIYGEIRGVNKDNIEAVYGILSDGVSYSEPFQLEQIENVDSANKYLFNGFGEGSEIEINESIGIIIIAHNGEGNMADYRQSNVTVDVNSGITFKPRRPAIIFYPSSTRLSAVVLGDNRANANSVIGKLTSASYESPEFEMELTGESSTKVLFDYIDEVGDFDPLNNNENEDITFSYSVLNSDGNVIDSGETSITTYVDPAVSIIKPKLKINEDGETFSLKVSLSGENKHEVGYLLVTITPEDGGSETESQEILLELSGENENRSIFLNEGIQFIEAGNVIDKSFSITTTAFYQNGDPCVEKTNCCVFCGETDHF